MAVTVQQLFDANLEPLQFTWLAGKSGSERQFGAGGSAPSDLVGYLNYIHPYRVQIVGRRESAYFTNSTPEDQEIGRAHV